MRRNYGFRCTQLEITRLTFGSKRFTLRVGFIARFTNIHQTYFFSLYDKRVKKWWRVV